MTQVLVANGQTLNTKVLIFAFLLLLMKQRKNDIRMMIQFTFSSQEYLFIYSIVESKIESNDAKKKQLK